MNVNDKSADFIQVAALYQQESKLGASILALKKAAVFSKGAAAESVVGDLFDLALKQNQVINSLVHGFLNQRMELDALKQRVGL